MSTVEVSIIIPALNESLIVLKHVDEVASWLGENGENSFELIVVDDGSRDGMFEILVEASATRSWLKIVQHPQNLGRGRAVRSGFEHSSGNYVVCLDADLSYAPYHIASLLEPLRSGVADLTLASAYHPGGEVLNVPFQRALLSRMGNRLLAQGLSSGLNTVTCVVRGYTREVVDCLELVADGKELHLETLQKALLMGYRIKEVPAKLEWRDKARGSSKKVLPDIALIKMRRTVLSHLVFNYISNPGILLMFPTLSLSIVVVIGIFMIAMSFFENLASEQGSLFQVARLTLLEGQLSLAIVLFSMIALTMFIAFYFLSAQSKRYFDETYTLLMRMNHRVKLIEQKQADSSCVE